MWDIQTISGIPCTQLQGGGGQVPYTFQLRITCKKGRGEERVQMTCKIAYMLNGRPLIEALEGESRDIFS